MAKDRVTGGLEIAGLDVFGAQVHQGEFEMPRASSDGRVVAFVSDSAELVPGRIAEYNVFVRDLGAGTTELISVDSNGAPANGNSLDVDISEDGRFVVFTSEATNLTAIPVADQQVYLHDRRTHTTRLISAPANGDAPRSRARRPSISGNGSIVVFESASDNLVEPDTNQAFDIFIYDARTNALSIASTSSTGEQANNVAMAANVSSDGSFVAFATQATNLVAGDGPEMDVSSARWGPRRSFAPLRAWSVRSSKRTTSIRSSARTAVT